MDTFDLIVIGSGPGGYVAAIRAAQKGLKTAVIESRDVGGTCLNRGCIPTKAMLHSAHLYKQALQGELFGLTAQNIGFDFEKINQRKIDTVLRMRSGTERLLKTNKVKIIRGKGMIKDPYTVAVDTKEGVQEFGAAHIIIATGSKPKLLPEPMRGLENVITSDEALALDAKLYKRILISGGGVIGVEFASIYKDLGCEVTIVGSRENLLRRLDPDISANLMKLFARRGIEIITPARIRDIQKAGDALACTIEQEGEHIKVECDGILTCIGRAPVTEGLFAPGVCVELDGSGFVLTNENLQTSIPNIYAIGDCTAGSTQLAHAASAQGLNAVSRILGEAPPANLQAIPTCVYTSPEIASVGLMDFEAEEKGIEIKVGKYMMTGNGKSIVTNEDRGFIKLVFDAQTEVLLGAQLMCARATDIISELTTAIANRMTAHELASAIRPHPTYVEGITEAVESIFGLSIHSEKMAMPTRG